MKASSWLSSLPKKKFLLGLLVLVLLKLNTAAVPTYHGVVGGNVTLYCPVGDPQKLQFLYLQKGHIFINGYFGSRDMPPTWPNTRIDSSQTAFHMYGLNLSHAGEYQCCFKSNISKVADNSVRLYLSVTAPFHTPLITKVCGDDNNGCTVTCASHSGYPRQQITWQMESVGSQTWKEEKYEVVTNQTTMMLNVSSTAYVNCSSGEVNVSCSVGNITSDMISICAPHPSSSINLLVIIAVVCILAFGLICAVICVKFTILNRRTAASATTNGLPLEVVALAGNTGGEEAP